VAALSTEMHRVLCLSFIYCLFCAAAAAAAASTSICLVLYTSFFITNQFIILKMSNDKALMFYYKPIYHFKNVK
jgi:hypothetical protein